MCGFSRFLYTPEANFLFICSDYFLTTLTTFTLSREMYKKFINQHHPFGCRMISVLDPTEILLQNKITSIWQNVYGADIKLTCILEYSDR